MTRTGKNARTSIDPLSAAGRLVKAKSFHEVAKLSADLLQEDGMDRGPVVSNAILAAIAYSDAITIATTGKVSKGDHNNAATLLSECVGKDIKAIQLADFKNLLAIKDAVQYGARYTTPAMATKAMAQLGRFSEWAIAWLRDKGIQ